MLQCLIVVVRRHHEEIRDSWTVKLAIRGTRKEEAIGMRDVLQYKKCDCPGLAVLLRQLYVSRVRFLESKRKCGVDVNLVFDEVRMKDEGHVASINLTGTMPHVSRSIDWPCSW